MTDLVENHRLERLGVSQAERSIEAIILVCGKRGAADVIAGQIKGLAAAYGQLVGAREAVELMHQVADQEMLLVVPEASLVPKSGGSA